MKSVYLLKDILAQLSVAACDGVLTMIKLRERLLFEYFTKVTHDVKTRLEAAREIKLGAISILWYRFHALNKSIFRCLLRTHDRCIQNDFFKKKKKKERNELNLMKLPSCVGFEIRSGQSRSLALILLVAARNRTQSRYSLKEIKEQALVT